MTNTCIDPNWHTREFNIPEDWTERVELAEAIVKRDVRLSLDTWRLLIDAIHNGLPVTVSYLARRNDWNSPGPLYRETVTGVITELYAHPGAERICVSCWGITYTLYICNLVGVQTPEVRSERVE